MDQPLKKPSLQVAIQLNSITEFDSETGFWTAHFEGFPQAIAYEETEHKAIMALIEVFQVMLREQRQTIMEELLQHYGGENERDEDIQMNMITA